MEYLMNERIKALAEQAEKYADDNFRGEPTWSEAFESKFAELIVKECASLFPLTFTDEQYQRRIDKTILNHFRSE
jgi:hypothetical protein